MNNFFREKMLPKIAVLVIKILSFTHRFRYINLQNLNEIKKSTKNVIFAFWHGRQFILVNSHKYQNICIMTSLSKDGDLQTNILSNLGYKTVRGSSSNGGAKALVKMLQKIKNGCDAAFAIDGPRGPIYEAKPGVLFLAQKTKLPIIPVATAAEKFWQLKNWDEYTIPKPFTKTAVKYGNPIYVSLDDNIDEKCALLNQRLKNLTKELDDEIRS